MAGQKAKLSDMSAKNVIFFGTAPLINGQAINKSWSDGGGGCMYKMYIYCIALNIVV